MRTIRCFSLLLALILTCGEAGYAQNPSQDNTTREQRREKFIEAQARHIADELALDDNTSRQFVDTYKQYKQELWALSPEPRPESRPNPDEMGPNPEAGPRPEVNPRHGDGPKPEVERSDEAIKQSITAQFDREQKTLDIRRTYYAQFSAFLTQQQIAKMYRIERNLLRRVSERRRAPERRPRN